MSSHPVLKRFEITVYKAKNPPTDLSIVPADSLVEFYKPGATVRSDVQVVYSNPADPVGYEVEVWYVGTIQAGENVRVDITGYQLEVTTVISTPGSMKLIVANTSIQPYIQLVVGQRLLRLADRPVIYLDPAGKTPTTSSHIGTDSSTGRAGCYLFEERFDCLAPISPQEGRILADQLGFFVAR